MQTKEIIDIALAATAQYKAAVSVIDTGDESLLGVLAVFRRDLGAFENVLSKFQKIDRIFEGIDTRGYMAPEDATELVTMLSKES